MSNEINKMFNDAQEIINSALEIRKTNYSHSLKLFNLGVSILEKLISDNPISDISRKLKYGEILISGYTLEQIKTNIIGELSSKSVAETNLLECTMLVANRVDNTSDKAHILVKIASNYIKLNKLEKAHDVLLDVLYMIEGLKNIVTKISLMPEISGKLYEIGKIDECSDLMERCVNELAHIEQINTKDDVIAKVAMKYFELGEYGTGYELLDFISNDNSKSGTMGKIAMKMVEINKDEKALEISKRIDNEFYRSTAMNEICSKYIETKQIKKAIELIKIIEYDYLKAEAITKIIERSIKDATDKAAYILLYPVVEIAKDMEDMFLKADLLSKLALKYAEMEQYDQALHLVALIEFDSTKALTMADILLIMKKSPDALDNSEKRALHEIINE